MRKLCRGSHYFLTWLHFCFTIVLEIFAFVVVWMPFCCNLVQWNGSFYVIYIFLMKKISFLMIIRVIITWHYRKEIVQIRISTYINAYTAKKKKIIGNEIVYSSERTVSSFCVWHCTTLFSNCILFYLETYT